MKRRPKGSGTITRIADGRYRARFPFTIGKREEIQGSPFPSYERASAALDGLLAALAEGDTVRGGITLRRLGDICMDRREKDGYKAIKSFRSCWASYVETWAQYRMPARDLTPGIIREWLANMSALGLSTQTRRNALTVLRTVLECGVDDRLLAENVSATIKIKDHGDSDDKNTHLDIDETLGLLKASGNDIAISIAVGTGIRSGELRSLTWDNVKLDATVPHLIVRYGAPRVSAARKSSTKSGKVRRVPLFGVALQALRAVPEAERVGIVLPNMSNGYRPKGRLVAPEDWAAWKRAAGITRRVRWHDLRHTCATLCLTGAWDGTAWTYEQVKDLLGHSSVKVTERYARSLGLAMGHAAAMMAAESATTHRVRIGPTEESEEVMQASEMIQRRGWDSNPRMTVLQTGPLVFENEELGALWALSGSYIKAVVAGDVHVVRRGLELAAAVDAMVKAQARGGDRAVAS